MTHSKLILMAGIIMVLAVSVTVAAQGITKDVNVINEPNVNVLNNVETTITNDGTNPVPVTVQNGVAEKELVEIVELDVANATTAGTVFDVYTVGTGKRLVITDVIVTNVDTESCRQCRHRMQRHVLTTTLKAPDLIHLCLDPVGKLLLSPTLLAPQLTKTPTNIVQ